MRKIARVLILPIMILFCSIGLSACFKKDNGPKTVDLLLNNTTKVLTWNTIKGASVYAVEVSKGDATYSVQWNVQGSTAINGKCTLNIASFLTSAEIGLYKFRVDAKTASSGGTSVKLSNEVSFSNAPAGYDFSLLPMPSNVNFDSESKVLSWIVPEGWVGVKTGTEGIYRTTKMFYVTVNGRSPIEVVGNSVNIKNSLVVGSNIVNIVGMTVVESTIPINGYVTTQEVKITNNFSITITLE